MVFFIVTMKFVLYKQGRDEYKIHFEKGTIHAGNDLDGCEWSGLDQEKKLLYLKEAGYIIMCTNINDIVKSFLIKD